MLRIHQLNIYNGCFSERRIETTVSNVQVVTHDIPLALKPNEIMATWPLHGRRLEASARIWLRPRSLDNHMLQSVDGMGCEELTVPLTQQICPLRKLPLTIFERYCVKQQAVGITEACV